MSIAALLLFALVGVAAVIGWLGVLAPSLRARATLLVAIVSAANFVVTAAGGVFAPLDRLADANDAALFAVGRLVSGVCLGATFLLTVFLVTGRLGREQRAAMRHPGVLALGACLLLQLASVPFATVPSFQPQDLYALFGVLAIVCALGLGAPPLAMVRTVRLGGALLCAGSLAWLAVDAAGASSTYTESLIGLPLRLHGLYSHANGLGYVAGVVLLLGGVARLRGESFWRLVAVAALVLAQSKTAWGAFAIALVPLAMHRLQRVGGGRAILGRMGLVVLALAGAWLVVNGVFQLPVDATLTGRTALWERVTDNFRANPIGGYGPTMLGPTDNLRYEFVWAGHAHNQLVQTAGQSGLIGLAGLAILLIALWSGALRHARATRGASLAATLYLCVRAVSEPLLNVRWDSSLMIVVAVALLCGTPARRTAAEAPADPDPDPDPLPTWRGGPAALGRQEVG